MNAVYDPALKSLLARAARAYRNRDDAAFRALLLDMIARAPHRADLRFDLGNHYIQHGMVDAAISVFSGLLDEYPGDPDALAFLAHWRRFAGDADEVERLWTRLGSVRPERASDLARIWSEIDRRLSLSPTDELPGRQFGDGRPVILALGLALAPDGSMLPGLTERLEKTAEAAGKFEKSRIIVSGGMPRAGKIEAREMRDWLVARGIAAERIFEEGYSRDLVENMVYSRQILDPLGARTVLIVTSANNVRRAGAVLEIVGWTRGSAWKSPVAVSASGESLDSFVDDGRDRLKLHRDCLRAYGLPMMRTFPELAEL